MGEMAIRRSEDIVIGHALSDAGARSYALARLKSTDFTDDRNRAVWEAIERATRRHEDCDIALITRELEDSGKIDFVGGYTQLFDYVDLYCEYPLLEKHVEEILEHSGRRLLHAAAYKIFELSRDGTKTLDEIHHEALAIIAQAKTNNIATEGLRAVSDIVPEIRSAITDIGAKASGGIFGAPTGIKTLDWILKGLAPGNLVTIGARPGVGKTAMALNIAIAASSSGSCTAIFSIEMSRVEIGMRMLSSLSGKNVRNLAIAKKIDESFDCYFDKIGSLPIYVDDTAPVEIDYICAETKRINRDLLKSGRRIDVVIIDYMQIIKASSRMGGDDKDTLRLIIADAALKAKTLARSEKCCVVCPCQLNRELARSARKRKPLLSDLAESDAIGHTSDIVMIMTADENNDSRVDLHVIKHRNGFTGSVALKFDKESQRFYEEDFDDVADIGADGSEKNEENANNDENWSQFFF